MVLGKLDQKQKITQNDLNIRLKKVLEKNRW